MSQQHTASVAETSPAGPSPDIHFANGVLTSSLGQHPANPYLDHVAYRRLAGLLEFAGGDDDTRVVVLHGFGGCFCRGGDVGEFLDASKHEELIQSVTALFRALANFPKPLVAAVDGDAIGVGCTLLFHCDYVVATASSTLRVPFVDYGLVPDAATSILAPQRMGYGQAFRFFCLGEKLTAKQAHVHGLVSEVADDGGSETAANEVARALARKPAKALVQTRQLMRGDTQALCRRIDEEISLFHGALKDEATLRRLRLIARKSASSVQ